jgi:acetone carboxylase gamma subunit
MPESYPRETIEDLVDENLEWSQLHEMMSKFKDDDRFQQVRAVLQERVDWDDPIVLPYADHLYVVAKPDDRWMIKCDCGHEFCEHDENWKREALIRVRDSEADYRDIYPEGMHPHPDYMELREFFCPGCKTLLEVTNTMPGYPLVHEFEPDIETFYEEWIDEPVPTADEATA